MGKSSVRFRLPVLFVVPTTIAEVNTPQEGEALIYDNKFLMVGPKEDATRDVVRMAQHFYIGVLRTKLLLAVK